MLTAQVIESVTEWALYGFVLMRPLAVR